MKLDKKFLPLIAVIPLVAGILVGASSFQAIDAQTGVSTAHHMDIEEEDDIGGGDAPGHEPTTELISIDRFRPSSAREDITYSIQYRLVAGDTDLMRVHVKAQSDIDSVEQTLGGITAGKSQKNTLRIKAIDPDSITGGVVGYTLAPPTSDPRNPNPDTCPDC